MSDKLRSWLRRQEHPVKLRLDGEKLLDVPSGRGKWKQLVESIRAMAPKKLEALRADGSTIRAYTYDAESDEDDDEKPQGENVEIEVDTSTPHGALAFALMRLVESNCAMAETVRECANDAMVRATTAETAFAQVTMAEAQARAALIVAQGTAAGEAAQGKGPLGEIADIMNAVKAGQQAGAAEKKANGAG